MSTVKTPKVTVPKKMTAPKGVTTIRCMTCGKDITHKVKIYWKGRVMCQDCNVRQGVT